MVRASIFILQNSLKLQVAGLAVTVKAIYLFLTLSDLKRKASLLILAFPDGNLCWNHVSSRYSCVLFVTLFRLTADTSVLIYQQ